MAAVKAPNSPGSPGSPSSPSASSTASETTGAGGDRLALANNKEVLKLLQKEGKNSPTPEVVRFSEYVVKINRREKEQTRVLIITNKAIYNLVPNNYTKSKRRIDIEKLVSITASKASEEFVIHIPDEYDYRFKSNKKEKICEVLGSIYREIHLPTNPKAKLPIAFVDLTDLKDMTMTKAAARLLSREALLKRKQQLVAVEHESDKEDKEPPKDSADGSSSSSASAAEMKDNLSPLLENGEKVRLDDFELLKVLGRGSFGKVMQVRKKTNNKIYAMKILKKRAIIARNQVEHTKAERKILQALQHPFLMTLRYAFQSKEKLYFVLDYFQGGELFFHLKSKRRFSEEVARLYVAEIALALGHLHSLQYIYRDLKPENILLDDVGHVCLTDFGLSKDVEEGDKAHTFCGTPEYLAPEIVTGSGHDKAVDWWSLGILLYELTVGIPPFYSQNVNEMYNKIQHGVLRFPPFLSEPCKNLIVALLNRDPKKRLGSTTDVDEIKIHPFFAPINWDKLMKKEIDPPYKPKVAAQDDTSNFEVTFTQEPVVDSVVPQSSLSSDVNTDQFNQFTFKQKQDHL